MEETRSAEARKVLYSEAEQLAIRHQLERMLANPLFRHSKRYPHLLRHVVERTLEGNAPELKERTIGVVLFARDLDYDTNADPIVRATAGEVRKRIAQYYFEPGHETELRIDLTPGSYVPEFVLPCAAPVEPPRAPAPEASPALAPVSHRVRPVWIVSGALCVLLFIAFVVSRPWRPHSAVDQFWGPVLEGSDTVRLCVGQRRFLGSAPESPQQANPDLSHVAAPEPSLFKLYYMGSQNVALTDAVTIARLTGLLESRGRAYHIRGESFTSFDDLRDGPVVLVGAFNNDWTLRLTGPQRFNFERENDTFLIRDRQNPTRKNRAISYNLPYTDVTKDYALISRVLEPTTERMVVVAAGLTGYGTLAAGEFLTNPAYLGAMAKNAPRDWEHKNLQLVIATEVIHGNSGPPHVVDQYFW
jgi:hypothetical protein